MKKLKLFFALFAMLALGVGNAWAQTVTWEKATSIAAGDVVALVCDSKKMELSGISTTSTKYGIGVAYTSTPAGAYVLTVEAGNTSGTYSFKCTNGQYLYWTSGNSLATNATKSANTSWKVTFSGETLTIANAKDNSRKLQWNASSPRFACYTGSQTAVQLYKKVTSDDVIVKTLKSIEVTLKTINYETGDVFKFDGTCTATYSVTKNGEPQDDETAVVTPTTVSTPDMSTAGTKEITVTYTEGDVTVTDKYEINVTENVVTPGAYDITLNNVFFGTAASTNITGPVTGKKDDITITINGTGSTKPRTDATYTRFYANSTMAISVPSGYVIKSIAITKNESDYAAPSVNVGTFNTSTKTWTGSANSVTMSFSAKSFINSIKVTYDVDVKYVLNITTPSNGTLVVKEGSTVLTDGAQVYEGTKLVVTPTPNAGYVFESLTVDGSAVELTDDGTYTFNMPAADVTISATFKENEKPAATLTLSKNGETEDITGYKQDDKVTLPSITSDCVKEFVGWSANASCATEPEYKAGDEYTLASTTQTLYAVYATVGAGGEATAANTLSSNGWANESKHTSLEIDENVQATITGGGNSGKYYNSGTNWRLYQNENATITISTTVGELKSVKFTFTNSNTGTFLYGSTILTSGTAVEVSGTSATFTVGNSGTATNGQIRISKIEVVYTGGVSYSNYSTTCVAALDEPVFSVEGGENEAKTITLTATEGTIYYTLDGSTPTASSEKYTTPIVLDECGEHTIKAIAISSDSESPVASATYQIQLPILANSETDPYTETEAVEVYNGGCYDGEELVYVKGTVKTATFYTSGTYTITLTNGFQFYKFYKSATKELFTDGAINAGDVLVACGKLSKFNTTYQLAEGCYLVAHEKYEGEKTDISNTEETAYTVDKAFELIGDVSSDLTKEVYVKGLVAVAPTSNPTADGQMTYSISDNGEKTGKVLTVYLGLNLNGEKFTSKNDVQLGDYVVVKGLLFDYNGTYELNKGNQLVQHKKAATITIADITMEVGETKTIAATITPAAAETAVTYTIKENAANAISLSGNVITANTVGTATITATIATAADYMGKTVDFTVTVNAKSTKEKVVILAEYEGQWYAMKAQYVTGKTSHLAPLPVTYFDGKLYNVNEADKALIEWERAVVDGKATFYNDGKYLSGTSGATNLTLATTTCEWTVSGDSYLIGSRTFLYNAENNWFRNFGTGNAGNKNYSGMPTVTAPVYATGDIVYTRTVTNKYGTICLPYASASTSGATFFEVVGQEDGNKVYLASVTELEAGVPYIFEKTANTITVTCQGEAVAEAASANGLIGNFTNEYVVPADNYILYNNAFIPADGTTNKVNAYRAYLDLSAVTGGAPQQMPGRRYIGMDVQGENVETGVEDLFTTDAPVKVIENGQLIIIRDGVKYNVQGQKL